MKHNRTSLHAAVMQQVERMVSLPTLAGRVLVEKAEKAGHPLTAEQRGVVEERLTEFQERAASGSLDETSVCILKRDGVPDLVLEEADLRQAHELMERVLAGFPEILERMIPTHATAIYEAVCRGWRQHVTSEKAERRGFVQRLQDVWGEGLDGLWLLVCVSQEIGGEMARALGADATQTQRLLFRLHARACQIGEEIVVLLREGFADGAHARWRTLHEIAVVAFFIAQHGDYVAESYEAHVAVEAWKSAQHYQEFCARLGAHALSDEEMGEIQKDYDDCLSKYGKPFKGDYGWAAVALGNDSPKFGQIEAAVDLEHHRPVYRMAGHNVHANPKGAMFRLGQLHPNILLAGPSNAGLADPGSDAAASLAQVTVALMGTREATVDDALTVEVLLLLSDDVRNAFLEADAALLERERLLRIEK